LKKEGEKTRGERIKIWPTGERVSVHTWFPPGPRQERERSTSGQPEKKHSSKNRLIPICYVWKQRATVDRKASEEEMARKGRYTST